MTLTTKDIVNEKFTFQSNKITQKKIISLLFTNVRRCDQSVLLNHNQIDILNSNSKQNFDDEKGVEELIDMTSTFFQIHNPQESVIS